MTDLWRTIKGKKQTPRERNYVQVEEFQESALDYERRGVGIYDQDLRLTSTIDSTGGEKTIQRALEASERRTLPPLDAFKMQLDEFRKTYDVLKVTDVEMDDMMSRIPRLRFVTYKNPSVYLLAFIVFQRGKKMLDQVENIADEQDIPMSLIVKYIRYFQINDM